MGLADRLQHAWNSFKDNDRMNYYNDYGSTSYYRPDRIRIKAGNERSIITSITNRISLDVSAIKIIHAELDENERFKQKVKSGLNYCFNDMANKDQTARAFIQDVAMSMMDEGCVAIVPIDTTINPNVSGSFDIESMRVGKIVQWYPDKVKLNVYNDRTGLKEDIVMDKKSVAIIENPLYAVMNEPNSTMQRLIRKLNLLDVVDEQSSSGKLDLIIKLPYVIKGEQRRKDAEKRRKDIEMQLEGSKYGIAYVDGTENITQLNRPVENNLMKQIEYLTEMLYSQIGLTKEIMNGTADEAAMLNYYNRTVEPIVSAIVDGCRTKFITKTARTQGKTLMTFRDPFKLVPINSIADIADKFTRNEILSSNEVRGIIGFMPSKDPSADELRNKNLNKSNESVNDVESSEPLTDLENN